MTTESMLARLRQHVVGADQLVLFGSRAAGVERADSDWDVLLVRSAGPVVRDAAKLDLVELSESQLHSPEWLGSELAGHVASYGCWVIGEPTWTKAVHSSKRAIERKCERLKARLHNMCRSWETLQPAYQKRFAIVVRRDVQRYRYLAEGRAIAPSSLLDEAWCTAEMEAAVPLIGAHLSAQAAHFLEKLLVLASPDRDTPYSASASARVSSKLSSIEQ